VPHIKLERVFIEFIHDVLVGLWMPFDEQVDPADYKDIPLLESAAGRPFQTFGGEDLYASVAEKAAVLFHSLICNHCFRNGNKRTAVISVDLFLSSNGYALAMSNEEVYEVATETAKSNAEGRKSDDVVANLIKTFSERAISLEALDLSTDTAREVGRDRVERMVNRLLWYRRMVKKIPEEYWTPPDAEDAVEN
jgi:death-on-curing family protein